MLETTLVEPNDLRPNPWNTNIVSPDNEEKLKASLKRFGFFRPILCRETASGDLEIVGGEHRWQAAKSLGYDKVPVINLGAIDDDRAKEIGLVDNGRYGSDDAIALAELLDGLTDDVSTLSAFLPQSETELSSLFSSVSIDLDDLDLDDEPSDPVEKTTKAPKTHQIMRFKVSLEDAETLSALIEKTQSKQGFDKADQLTNAGDALVHLLFGDTDAA